MKEEEIDRISRLLGKCAAGQITDAERAELQAWADRGERAAKLLEKTQQRIIAPEDAVRFAKGMGTAAAWSELQRRLARQKRRRAARAASWSAAAVVVLAAGLFMLRPRGAAPQEIDAPRASVVLELPDGSCAMLDDTLTLAHYGAARQGQTLAYNGADTVAAAEQRLHVGRGGDFALTLADGTRVTLNSDTRLTYPSRFEGGERRVELSGEAYFEVARNVRPFIVHAGGMDVRVTGTEFNVMAYSGAATAEVTLVRGGVSARTAKAGIELAPGQRAVYRLSDHSLTADDVDVALHTSWRQGIFEFRAMPLSQIIPQLERWYDVDVVFADARIGDVLMTGAVKKNNSLNHLLDILVDVKQLDYTVQGRKVIITNRR